MRAVNDFVIISVIKEGPKKVGGFILTEGTDETNRYLKAEVKFVGDQVEKVKEGDLIYYDYISGHDISFKDELYRVIRMKDIVLVE